ncbi:MAG TPA: low molecular weight protein-tyrosine-phosphatase [Alphaproteobacteria bacterium]|nr:low molecular weight protein-tyrosine-phosphatase [Alphaproteobacteria bacterium]
MLRILFVCTGNICRSPTAEGVLRHRLAQQGLLDQVETLSAGTQDYHIGDPPDARAQRTAKTRGYDLSRLRARQVTPDHFDEFDLILAMDRSHQLALRRMAPAEAQDRVRLFMEFAPGAGLRDVPDPYYGEADDFELALDLIEAGVEGLIRAIKSGEIPHR